MPDGRLSTEEWAALKEQLLAEGYEPRYVYADHNAVIVHPCELDGATMDYIGLQRESSYRAFAVCRQCKTAVEF